MKRLDYQYKAVNELVDKTITLMSLEKNRHKLIFKAPTGSGKTVMTAMMLDSLITEMQNRGDCPYQEAAFIWIAPNKLHQQSFKKIKRYFSNTRTLNPMRFEDLSEDYLHSNDILFLNWESINKENNVAVREDEQGRSLYDITFNTRLKNIPIIVIIDEEHLFWSSTADKSKKVLEKIAPKVELRVSATPKSASDYQVTVPRKAVIDEEMIKKGVVMNPDLRFDANNELQLNQILIETALKKREELATSYKKLGINLNPLLLIQLPNDKKEQLTSDDKEILEQVEQYLINIKGITVENQKLAIWLSNRKENLLGLEDNDSLTEVLLFKQAIALGWDCPRAAVLLIFRKLESQVFTVQTVGRILRMPEQKYYTDDSLNTGFVYTDVSKDQIQIVAEDASYLTTQNFVSKSRNDLHNIEVQSFYNERKGELRNILSSDYKKILNEELEAKLHVQMQDLLFPYMELLAAENKENENFDDKTLYKRQEAGNVIELNVKNINIPIPKDVKFQNDVGIVDVGTKVNYSRTSSELRRIFLVYCRSLLHDFESESTERLAKYIIELMSDAFAMTDDEVIKCVLYHKNKRIFSDIISRSLIRYKKKIENRKQEAKNRNIKSTSWSIPKERIYEEQTHYKRSDVNLHALMPFVELKTASNPEKEFSKFLEENSKYIDWWYKNGDHGKDNFAVEYINSKGIPSLFYVDFIIRLKNGDLYFFDTKSVESDPEAVNKHNGFVDYIQKHSTEQQPIFGGILIYYDDNWKYSHFKIETTLEVAQWDSFEPKLANQKKK